MYIGFYFELADDTYSVLVFVLTPYFYVFLLFICGVQQTCHRLQLNSNLSSLTTSEIQGELMLLAWTGSSSSSLDALNFRHGLDSYVFLAFRILLV